MSRFAGLLVAVAALLPASVLPAAEVPHDVTIVGSAEVKLTGGENRGSARVVFAAAAAPASLRLEVVRAGSVGAVVFCDSERLRILVPGARPLLHESVPTRAAFERTLGLPFSLAELLFALRVGNAPAPDRDGRSAVPVRDRQGRVLGLRREGGQGRRPDHLRFSRFRAGPSGDWPARAVLETDGSVATLLFGALRPHATAPLDLDPQAVERSREVGVDELRQALGLEETKP